MAKALTGDVFSHEMTKTSKVFSRDGKLQVILGGDKAGTDGHTVILPGVDAMAEIDEYEARVLRGYVDHEAAHQRHTDIDGGWLGKAEKRNPYLGALVQALEDVRIESRAIKEYDGAKTNLQATCEATVREINKIIEADGVPDERQLVPLAICMGGRNEHLTYTIPALDEFRKHIDDTTWSKCLDWADRAIKAQNTGEVYDIALEIEPDEDPQEEQDQQNKPMPGQGNDAGALSSDLAQGVDATAQDIGLAGDQDQGVFAREFDFVVEFDPNIKQWRLKQAALAPHIERKVLAEAGTVLSPDVVQRINDRLPVAGLLYLPTARVSDYVKAYEDTRHQISGAVAAIKSAFERYFISKMNRGWEVGKPEGRLDPKRLASVIAGASNVFRQREEIDEMDTCVAITIDCSSSMGFEKMEAAKQSLIAIGEALEKMRIPFLIQGHTSHNLDVSGTLPNGTDADYYYATPTTIAVAKPFNARLADCRAGIAKLNANGGTPEGSGLSYLIDAVRHRQEKRRILMVLTDGAPNGGSETELLINQIKRLHKDPNISLFAIGIQTNAPSNYYGPSTVVIHDADDLARTIFAQIKGALDKKAA